MLHERKEGCTGCEYRLGVKDEPFCVRYRVFSSTVVSHSRGASGARRLATLVRSIRLFLSVSDVACYFSDGGRDCGD